MVHDEPLVPGDLLELGKANVKLVNEFIAAWYDPYDALSFDAFVAPDAVCRGSDTSPAVIGPKGVKDMMHEHLKPGDRVEVIIHQTFSAGTVVTNVRTDTVKSAGRKDLVFEIVGVFVVKKGKIVEWTDHVYTWNQMVGAHP